MAKFAKTGERIKSIKSSKVNRASAINAEEDTFIREKISKGLTDIEAARMFFRKFNRSISPTSVKIRRGNDESNMEAKAADR